jgi:hypothetical protein
VLNFVDDEARALQIGNKVAWYKNLLDKKLVLALDMDFMFAGSDFKRKLYQGINFMAKNNPPYLIHCFAGFDRTGFVAAVLEALMGANIEEIKADYAKSFGKSYSSGLNTSGGEDTVDAICEQMEMINDYKSIEDQDLEIIAQNYLLNTVKVNPQVLTQLKEKLS